MVVRISYISIEVAWTLHGAAAAYILMSEVVDTINVMAIIEWAHNNLHCFLTSRRVRPCQTPLATFLDVCDKLGRYQHVMSWIVGTLDIAQSSVAIIVVFINNIQHGSAQVCVLTSPMRN